MILCSDFGGTLTKLGLVDDGRIVAGATLDSATLAGEDAWLRVLEKSAVALCQSAGTGVTALSGMVWALPLVIDPGQRRATRSFGKFEAAAQHGFCERVESFFGIPLLLENDARAALIGEWQAGAGRGANDLVLVTLGTGIGTAAILDGKPLRGRSGMAGNLGGLSITHLGCDSPGGLPPGIERHAIQAGGPVEIVAGTLKDHAALLGCECIWKQAHPTTR